jgi:hypothetical protein
MQGKAPNPIQMLRFLDHADGERRVAMGYSRSRTTPFSHFTRLSVPVIIKDIPLGLGHWANFLIGDFIRDARVPFLVGVLTTLILPISFLRSLAGWSARLSDKLQDL